MGMEGRKTTRSTRPDQGFMLVEIMCATVVAVIGLLSLAGVMGLVSHQREQAAARRLVMDRMQNLFEEIRGVSPETVLSAYDGKTQSIPGVQGTNTDGTALSVDIDATDPKLLSVILTGNWSAAGQDTSYTLVMKIHNSIGKNCE